MYWVSRNANLHRCALRFTDSSLQSPTISPFPTTSPFTDLPNPLPFAVPAPYGLPSPSTSPPPDRCVWLYIHSAVSESLYTWPLTGRVWLVLLSVRILPSGSAPSWGLPASGAFSLHLHLHLHASYMRPPHELARLRLLPWVLLWCDCLC